MKRFLRAMCMVSAAAMLIACLSACGSSPQASSSQSPTTSNQTSPSPTPTAVEPAEPVVLHVFDAGGGVDGFTQDDAAWDTNPLGQKILADINVKIQFEFPTGDGNEKLNLLLTSGDYPDIVLRMNDVTLNNMVNEEIAIPLDDLIAQYGSNIKNSYGSVLDMLRFDDGKIYSLSRGYGEIAEGAVPPGFGSGFLIRQDVYEGIGSPAITDLDSIYNILVQLAEKYPTNHEGEKVWPISGFNQTWQNTMQTLLGGAGMESDVWYVNGDSIQYWVRAPQAVNVVKFYNKIYREGLLDPESFTIDRSVWGETKMQTARALTHFGGWWMNWTVENDYAAAGIPNAENMGFVPYAFSVQGGQTPKLTAINKVGAKSSVITTACEDPVAAITLLDYLSIPEINFAVQNGVEGVMWEMVDGKPSMKEEYKSRWLAGEADQKFGAETGLRMYHYFVSTDVGVSPWDTYWILKDDPGVMGDQKAMLRDANLGPYWYDSYPTSGLFAGAPDEIGMLDTLINERFNNQLYTCIMASSEEACVNEFNKFVAELESIGLKDYEEYANSVYQSRK